MSAHGEPASPQTSAGRRRLLLLTPSELTRDPRARRAAQTARRAGYDVVGLCGQVSIGEPAPLDGVAVVTLGHARATPTLRRSFGDARRRSSLLREASGVVRLVRLVRLTFGLVRAGRRLGRFAVIHANDLETLPAGWLLARRGGSRLLYDAHEIYGSQEPDPPRLFRAASSYLERALARRADAVVTVSERIADELRRSLRLTVQPTAILNCPPRADVEPAPRGAGPLRVVYQGAMGPGRRVTDLLDAAERADGVHLTIRIVNADLEELRRLVTARGLDGSVVVADPVSPDELVHALTADHVGVVINRPLTRNDELVLPNKLFEYFMAGLAVVVPRLPGLGSLVDAAQVGVVYEPAQPESLAAALAALADDPNALGEMRARARRLALDRYNAEVEGEVLTRIWDDS